MADSKPNTGEEPPWLKEIKNKVAALISNGSITEEQAREYFKGLAYGATVYPKREWRFGQPLSDYSYTNQYDSEDYQVDGISLDKSVKNDGNLTTQNMYIGFAPQIYANALKGEVIIFPANVNYSNATNLKVIQRGGWTHGQTEQDIREIMAERWRYAMNTFTPEVLSENFGMYNKNSIHYNETYKKPNENWDFIDEKLGTNRYVRDEYKFDTNYSNFMLRFLKNNVVPDNEKEYYKTNNGVIAISSDREIKAKQFKYLSVSPNIENVPSQINSSLNNMFTKGMSTTTIMDNMEANTGVSNTKSGFRIYNLDTFNQASDYMVKYFEGGASNMPNKLTIVNATQPDKSKQPVKTGNSVGGSK